MKTSVLTYLLSFLLPTVVQANADLATEDDLKTALHEVLSHNDLFDAEYLSAHLGIGLRIRQQDFGHDAVSFQGTATTSPSILYGSISYYVEVDAARKTSMATLTFGSKRCERLSAMGSEWHVTTTSGWATDGGPFYENLAWPADNGIQVSVSGCGFRLTQNLPRAVTMTVSPAGPRNSPDGLSRQIGDLLLSSDLRDYKGVGHILNTDFEVNPQSLKNELLYVGNATPAGVISGFKSSSVTYYGDDSGWYRPPSFFARPWHIGDRTVILSMEPDTDVVCLPGAQLASDLKRRSDRIQSKHDRDQLIYSVVGANRVNVEVTSSEGCISRLVFDQLTDTVHSLNAPIMFPLRDSLDRVHGTLSSEAERKLDVLAFRVKSVQLRGMEVSELPIKDPLPLPIEDPRKGDVNRLKVLINEALLRKQITVVAATNSVETPGFSDEVGQCAFREQPREPTVCVDAWYWDF